MKKQTYIKTLLRLMSVDEIRKSSALPTPFMSKTHVLLHYVALRRLGYSMKLEIVS